ncbi:hypothetical protein THAOC_30533, partial [Thalassiosira oceanica]
PLPGHIGLFRPYSKLARGLAGSKNRGASFTAQLLASKQDDYTQVKIYMAGKSSSPAFQRYPGRGLTLKTLRVCLLRKEINAVKDPPKIHKSPSVCGVWLCGREVRAYPYNPNFQSRYSKARQNRRSAPAPSTPPPTTRSNSPQSDHADLQLQADGPGPLGERPRRHRPDPDPAPHPHGRPPWLQDLPHPVLLHAQD